MGFFSFFSHSRADKNKSHLKNLLSVAMSDGSMDVNEAKALLSVATRLAIDEKQVREMMTDYRNIKFILPKDRKERVQQLWDLVMIVLADGRIEEREMMIFESFAHKLRIRKAVISGLVRKFAQWMTKEEKEPLDSFKGEFIELLSDARSWE